MSKFESKVFFVTGAGSGIGRATAIAAAAAGGKVMLTGTTQSALEETARLIGDDKRVALRCLDIADADDVESAVDETARRFGRLDFALNNAGIYGPVVPLDQYPVEDLRRVIEINVLGTMWCMRSEVKRMLPQSSGVIVNVASAGARKILRNSTAYIASKRAVVGLTEAAAIEYSNTGIRINALSPGLTRTAMTKVLTPEQLTATEATIPIGRIAEGADIADAIMWLFSDEARYVIGSDILVDGGFQMS